MGGIAGIVNYDGKPVERSLLNDMSAEMAHRGRSRILYCRSDNVGFSELRSYEKKCSIESSHSPSFNANQFIVFHGRIDNRNEVCFLLKDVGILNDIDDHHLVLAAYQKWGNNCTSKLLGDFAFAIWDSDKQILFCARDHMGIKPFYYICTDTFFAFASEIKGLLVIPGIDTAINRDRIADFFICQATDKRSTFYKNIFKLPPAHSLTLKNSAVIEECYWSLSPVDLQCKNTREYQESFLEIFKEAVRCRLSGVHPLGAYLSGGLDSSAIVCTAAGPLNTSFPGILHTFSGIFDRISECDERDYFQPVLEKYEIESHYVKADELEPGQVFDNISQFEDEPMFAPHFFMSWHLLDMAKQCGIKVLLDGHDGDSAVSYGYGLLPQLALQGRLIRLYREYMGFNNATMKSSVKGIKNLYRGLLMRKIFPAAQASRHKLRWKKNILFLNPSFAEDTKIEERFLAWSKKMPDIFQTEQQRHIANIGQPFHPMALEFLERMSSRFGINQCFPFFDVRLITFCVSLPAEEKLQNGYNRAIVRNSLDTLLPSSISRRKEKTDFSKNLADAYTKRNREWFSASMSNIPAELYDIVDRKEVEKDYRTCMEWNEKSVSIPLSKILLLFAFANWIKK